VYEQLAQGCYLKAERPRFEHATSSVASPTHYNHYATRPQIRAAANFSMHLYRVALMSRTTSFLAIMCKYDVIRKTGSTQRKATSPSSYGRIPSTSNKLDITHQCMLSESGDYNSAVLTVLTTHYMRNGQNYTSAYSSQQKWQK